MRCGNGKGDEDDDDEGCDVVVVVVGGGGGGAGEEEEVVEEEEGGWKMSPRETRWGLWARERRSRCVQRAT